MSETLDQHERIQNIAIRLKYLRDTMKPLYRGKQFRQIEVPNYIKEEVCKLYHEHGGIHILMRLCNVSYTHIKI